MPRLSSAMAWISSTITVRIVRSISRDFAAVIRMNSDSGVVTRMCGGCLRHLLPLGRPACRRCEPRCGSGRARCRALWPAPRSRPAELRGCDGRRSRAPSAAKHRPPASRSGSVAAASGAHQLDRGRSERRRASCRIRWARRSERRAPAAISAPALNLRLRRPRKPCRKPIRYKWFEIAVESWMASYHCLAVQARTNVLHHTKRRPLVLQNFSADFVVHVKGREIDFRKGACNSSKTEE